MSRKRKAARNAMRAGVGSARSPPAVPLWQPPTAQDVACDAASMTGVVGWSSAEPDALPSSAPRPIGRGDSRAQPRTVTGSVLNVRMINTVDGVITKLGPSFCAVNGGGWLVSTVSSARGAAGNCLHVFVPHSDVDEVRFAAGTITVTFADDMWAQLTIAFEFASHSALRGPRRIPSVIADGPPVLRSRLVLHPASTPFQP